MLRVYALLCVIGTILPLAFLGSFVADEGIDVGAFFDQLSANDISLFAWADVVISAVAVIVFAVHERAEIPKWWLAVAATLIVGVSLGLPLLLFLRERERLALAAPQTL